jgi:hypothetical protein
MHQWFAIYGGTEPPKMNAKSVRCDSYRGQVLEEKVPFAHHLPEHKQVCSLRRFMRREFLEVRMYFMK